MLGLPLPAFFGQCVPLGLQGVPLRCQGVALRFKLGQSSGELFVLLVDAPLSLFMLGLPLPAFFGQCVPLRLQAVPLCCQGVALRFKLGQSSGELFVCSSMPR